jgi:antitoxin component YwqK of YwqJK toxin-antitoxin module
MKKLLVLVLPALLMIGCETAEVGGVDLDDPETRKRIIAEAIDSKKLEWRGKKGEELRYAPDQNTPYTGWVKKIYDNGQIEWLQQYKDGKSHGLQTLWHENGQKEGEVNYKDGREDGLATKWSENGQKTGEGNYKDGKADGVWTSYNDDGSEDRRYTYKDGEIVKTE